MPLHIVQITNRYGSIIMIWLIYPYDASNYSEKARKVGRPVIKRGAPLWKRSRTTTASGIPYKLQLVYWLLACKIIHFHRYLRVPLRNEVFRWVRCLCQYVFALGIGVITYTRFQIIKTRFTSNVGMFAVGITCRYHPGTSLHNWVKSATFAYTIRMIIIIISTLKY